MAFMGLSFSSFQEYWTPNNLFYSVFIFSWVVFFWDMYVACRQYKVYRTSEKLPMELSGILERETFNKARLYSIDKSRYAILHNIWSQILNSVILLYDVMPKLWAVSGSILVHYGYDSSYEILRTLLLSNLLMLLSKAIELPWSIYFNFVVQEKHGFNRQTGWFFAKDKVKKLILETLMSSPILAGILYIIKIGGDYFFLYLWAFVSLVGLFMMTIYPNVIAPIFDKYMPFPEGPLKDKINELASSIKFPLTKILVVEGSKRSSHSNAYVYGFFNSKRIVIFDTLMENPPSFSKNGTETDQKPQGGEEQPLTSESGEASKEDERTPTAPKNKKGCNDDEIVAILGHELGHWKLNHALINVCIMEVQLFITFLIFGLLYKDPTIYRAFGFSDEPLFVGLLVITQYIFAPYHEILGFLMTCLTRYNEFAADNFSKKLNKASDLRSALIKLCADNLEFPIYDWLYSTINHSHPPLLERLQALGKID